MNPSNQLLIQELLQVKKKFDKSREFGNQDIAIIKNKYSPTIDVLTALTIAIVVVNPSYLIILLEYFTICNVCSSDGFWHYLFYSSLR